MSDTVFILGAGASAEAGAPVMENFLDVARDIARTTQNLATRPAFELVFRGIAALGAVFEKGGLDTDNLEAVFAAFEMAKLFGRLGSLSTEEIDGLPDALRAVIVETLERRIRFPIEQSGAGPFLVKPPRAYRGLVGLLGTLGENYRSGEYSIITFNYDLTIDHALHDAGHVIDYGLLPLPTIGAFPLLKLHGSLNWLRCHQCGIAAYPFAKYIRNRRGFEVPPIYSRDSVDNTFAALRFSEALSVDGVFEHCNGQLVEPRVPFVVPPTWSKGEHHQRIATVWAHAARHLSEARKVAIIGYSLPESDHFFRLLWSLGTVGPTKIEKIWVVNPGLAPGSDLDQRYRSLLGDVALKRYRPSQVTFQSSVNQMVKEFLL